MPSFLLKKFTSKLQSDWILSTVAIVGLIFTLSPVFHDNHCHQAPPELNDFIISNLEKDPSVLASILHFFDTYCMFYIILLRKISATKNDKTQYIFSILILNTSDDFMYIHSTPAGHMIAYIIMSMASKYVVIYHLYVYTYTDEYEVL